MRRTGAFLAGVSWAVALSVVVGSQAPPSSPQGPDPALQDRLSAAISNGDLPEARAALQMGASPDGMPDQVEHSPLVVSAALGHAPVVRLLLESGCRLEGPGDPGSAALSMALAMSNAKIVNALKKEAAKGEGSPFREASFGTGHEAVVRLLLDAGVDPNEDLHTPPLFMALVGGNGALVALLLEKGARSDLRLNTGETPLLLASEMGHEGMARLLLPYLTEVDEPDSRGNTPLLHAACKMDLQVHRLVSGEFQGENMQPFVDAIRGEGHLGVARALLEAGANPNAVNAMAMSPLMAAAASGGTEIMRALLDAGADPNLTDAKGRTALMFAAMFERLPAVELLLEVGADPKVITPKGLTALSLARAKANREIVKLLEGSGDSAKAPPETPGAAKGAAEETLAPAPAAEASAPVNR